MGIQPGNGKKPLIYYAVIAMIVILLLNAFVFPSLLEMSVTEVGYSEFLTMVKDGRVVTVSKNDLQITFIATNEKGREAIYKTGLWDDPTLTATLTEAGVTFSEEIPTQTSPILTFLISWIFPILLFTLLCSFMMKSMNGGVPNSLSFGKSGA